MKTYLQIALQALKCTFLQMSVPCNGAHEFAVPQPYLHALAGYRGTVLLPKSPPKGSLTSSKSQHGRSRTAGALRTVSRRSFVCMPATQSGRRAVAGLNSYRDWLLSLQHATAARGVAAGDSLQTSGHCKATNTWKR